MNWNASSASPAGDDLRVRNPGPALAGLLGGLVGALGVAMLAPLGVALALGEPQWPAFAAPAALALAAGWSSRRLRRRSGAASPGPFVPSPAAASRAYGFVVLAWGLAAVFGALPYLGIFGPEFWINALFESASGFSTTGASIFPEVESLPRSLLLWRSLTQWLGGLGIVILFVWLLGRHAFGLDVLTAEAPGPTPEKTEPRLAETARDTVIVGSVLTLALTLVLLGLGVGTFDAVCHALTTLSTGGFSTRDAGLAAFSPAVQWAVMMFMILGGVRFAIHVHQVKRVGRRLAAIGKWIRGEPRVPAPPAATYWRDPELRLYLFILAAATAVLFGSRAFAGAGGGDAIREAAFQAVSIITTTGFATADFDGWSDFARCFLLLLMFVGGSVGSTAGSIKVLRWLILFRKAPLALRTVTQPHTEVRVHVGRAAVASRVTATIGEFLLLFGGVTVFGALAVVAMGVEPMTAFSASAASVANVGPGLAGVGPAADYAFLPPGARLLLAGLMIAGRLEIVTVAVLLFAPLRHLRTWLRTFL